LILHGFCDFEAKILETTAYQKVLKLKPDLTRVHTDLGVVYLRKGLSDEAIAALKKALELKPDLVEAHLNLGYAYVDKGRYDDAIMAQKKAVELEPASAVNHHALGDAFLMKGEYGQAIKAYREALNLNPQDSSIQEQIALTYFLEGKFEDATKAYEKNPEKITSRRLHRVILQSLSLKSIGRDDDALKLLEDYAKAFKGEGWELNLLRYHQNQLLQSELISLAKETSKQCEAYFYIGYEYLLKGERQKAREYFQNALDTKAYADVEYIAARARLEQLGEN